MYNAGLLEQQINNCTMAHGQKSFHSVYRLHIHGHVIHGQKSFNSIYRLHGVPTAFIWNECITLSVRRKMPYFSRPAYTNLWCRAKTCRVKLKRCSVKTLCVVSCGDLLVRRDGDREMGSKKIGQWEKWAEEKRAVIQKRQKKNGQWEKWAVKMNFFKKIEKSGTLLLSPHLKFYFSVYKKPKNRGSFRYLLPTRSFRRPFTDPSFRRSPQQKNSWFPRVPFGF